jgi:hypothetical protein
VNEETGRVQAARIGGKFYSVNVTDPDSVTAAIAQLPRS